MKRLSTLALIFLTSFLLSLAVCAESADKLKYTCTLESANKSTAVKTTLSDDSYTTTLTLSPDRSLKLLTDGAEWIYIKFSASAPSAYTIEASTDDGSVSTINCGGTGFLHEVTRLPVGTTELSVSCDETVKLCEIELYSSGELPKDVQRWEQTLEECDLLVIATHSDDDTLFFGALIAEQIARARIVQTAFICGHSGEVHRLNELLDGQWTLGVTSYPIVGGFKDYYSTTLKGAQGQYDSNAISEFIVETVRRTKPRVIAAHDINGEYGHGAHRLTSKLTLDNIEHYGDEMSFTSSVESYGAFSPSKVYVHLYDENELILDVKRELEELDGASPFDIAATAYKCHRSQQKYRFKVTVGGTDDCRRFGLYHSNVECDPFAYDIMDGVDTVLPRVSAPSDESVVESMRSLWEKSAGAHSAIDSFDPFSVFVHDANGKKTTVPQSSVVVCMIILIIFACYVFFHFLHASKKRR